MRICYVDEAGCTGALPSATSDIQPLLVVCGVVFRQENLRAATRDFVELKKQFFPGRCPTNPSHPTRWILAEVKGSELRKHVVASSRGLRRHAIGFFDGLVGLLETYESRLIGRVWTKAPGGQFDGQSVYTSSIQYIHTWFNDALDRHEDVGLVICDSRRKDSNSNVSFSVFTQKFRAAGDPHPRIVEMPVFGHSENHAGVQIADLLSSGLPFPMAINAYCNDRLKSVHIRPGYETLRERYGARLEALQERRYNVTRAPAKTRGGIAVSDAIGRKPRSVMFAAPAPRPRGTVPALP